LDESYYTFWLSFGGPAPYQRVFFWRFQEHQMRASSKNLSFWLGWTVLVLVFVLVIAPPKKDNTRTTHTHTHYVCRPVVVHLRAQQFVVPIKNAKDHQFEESSKMPPFSGAFVLFCFVLCVYARSSSCSRRVLLPSERERKESKFSPQ
jgi:hypothetical protein